MSKQNRERDRDLLGGQQSESAPEPGSLSLASDAEDTEKAPEKRPEPKLPKISDKICKSCSDLAGELVRVVPENCAPKDQVHECQVCRSVKIKK